MWLCAFLTLPLLFITTQLSAVQLTSATHFGFAAETSGYKKFENAGGSMLGFSTGVILNPEWSVGLRTQADGAHLPGREFYRLFSTPVVEYRATRRLQICAGAGYFKESVTIGKQTASESQGTVVHLGWRRSLYDTERTRFSLGGFYNAFFGKARAVGTSEQYAVLKHSSPRTSSSSRGLEIALQITL